MRKKNIMLVDDDKIFNFLSEKTITSLGLANEIHFALNGKQALELLEEYKKGNVQRPDIIFLDLNMPEVDGFSFLKNFKDLPDPIKSKSKIVVLTSSNSAKDRSQAFTYPNVIQFITKPLKQSDIEDLKKLINHSEFTGQANS